MIASQGYLERFEHESLETKLPARAGTTQTMTPARGRGYGLLPLLDRAESVFGAHSTCFERIRGAFARVLEPFWQSAARSQEELLERLTGSQADRLLAAIDTSTIIGLRDKAILHVALVTGYHCTTLARARVGDLEFDGVHWWLATSEKRRVRRRALLLHAADPVLEYAKEGSIEDDPEGPLFRPIAKDRRTLLRQPLRRELIWRVAHERCLEADIQPRRPAG